MARPLDVARAAMDRRQWAAAYELLAGEAAVGPLPTDRLDALATVAYLTGREEEAFACWSEAHRRCLAAGDDLPAARLGLKIARGLGFKGDIGRSSGWVERVRRILDDAGADGPEQGHLEHAAGMCRIFEDGDIEAAHDCFARAAKLAERFRDAELRALAHIGEGRCRIYLGDVAEGLALLDEAMVAVEADEVGPTVAGDAYCTVIDACHELLDLRRCETWTASFTRWCDAQPDLVLYRGNCLLHRAELLQLHGQWAEGVAFAVEACRRLAEPRNLLMIGGAHYVEAELHRLRGDEARAEAAFALAHDAGCDPHPGLALLRLAQRRVDVADAAIRRAVAQAEGPIARARLLGPFVEIALAAGDVPAASAAADELRALSAELGSVWLQAEAARAAGAVLLASGEPAGALRSLRTAAEGWAAVAAPYEAARTRLLVAAACTALGDVDGATWERDAARRAFADLGAAGDLVRLDREVDGSSRSAAPGGLTGREVEVLRLVAAGCTNRAVAEKLFIAEKTVTSHLGHIFTKLGLSSRSAATAYAYEHGLVPR